MFHNRAVPWVYDKVFHQSAKRGASDCFSAVILKNRRMAKTLVTNSSAPTHDEISARAYEIYLRDGCVGGRDLDNWLQAEAELRNRNGSGNGHSQEVAQAPTGNTDSAKFVAAPPTTPSPTAASPTRATAPAPKRAAKR